MTSSYVCPPLRAALLPPSPTVVAWAGITLGIALCGCSASPGPRASEAPRLPCSVHLWHGPPATDQSGHPVAVVEIPAGSVKKLEVDKKTGCPKQDRKDGKPRVIEFLGYPANYGLMPRTLLPKEEGGDGDPLDVVVLGAPQPTGTTLSVRLIGVLHLVDEGETDDKLLAVPLAVQKRSWLANLEGLRQVQAQYPSLLQLIELWFRSYEGPGVVESKGWSGPQKARQLWRRGRARYHEHFR